MVLLELLKKLELKNYDKFLKSIGILKNMNFDIEEVGETQLGRWGKCKLATVAFGHGIATTLLQLAKGYSIIANGGFDINPTLLKKKIKKKKRILKKNIKKIKSYIKKNSFN